MLDVAFAAPSLPTAGALALFTAEGEAPGALWREVDEATGGALTRALPVSGFKGTRNQVCNVLAPGGGLTRVLLVGLGKRAEVTPRVWQEAGGTACAALRREEEANFAADPLDGAGAAALAGGAVQKAYVFDRYRTREKPEDRAKLGRVTVMLAAPHEAVEAWPRERAILEGVFLTRDLVSEPPNVLYPESLAERCETLTRLGVEVQVLHPEELREQKFNALLAVAQGSAREARVVVMRWKGGGSGQPLAFIGKGVTFDTGGISIKPAGGMEDMKWDMAGAGAVIGLMAAVAGRRAKADVVGIVGLVENMPSGTAQRPGDVVTTLSGQTVEIINTDAEGRMVLCDLLWYCQQRFAPRFMIDLATLTGAIIVSLGHEHAGMFSNSDELSERLAAAGRESGEKVWRMPMGEAYDRMLKSEIADMKHVGGRPGGSISAAQFLQRFVNDVPWVHLDIAGTAWSSKDAPAVPKGATAFGVRLLDRLVAEHYEG